MIKESKEKLLENNKNIKDFSRKEVSLSVKNKYLLPRWPSKVTKILGDSEPAMDYDEGITEEQILCEMDQILNVISNESEEKIIDVWKLSSNDTSKVF